MLLPVLVLMLLPMLLPVLVLMLLPMQLPMLPLMLLLLLLLMLPMLLLVAGCAARNLGIGLGSLVKVLGLAVAVAIMTHADNASALKVLPNVDAAITIGVAFFSHEFAVFVVLDDIRPAVKGEVQLAPDKLSLFVKGHGINNAVKVQVHLFAIDLAVLSHELNHVDLAVEIEVHFLSDENALLALALFCGSNNLENLPEVGFFISGQIVFFNQLATGCFLSAQSRHCGASVGIIFGGAAGAQ
jgi:hypothetical protein